MLDHSHITVWEEFFCKMNHAEGSGGDTLRWDKKRDAVLACGILQKHGKPFSKYLNK